MYVGKEESVPQAGDPRGLDKLPMELLDTIVWRCPRMTRVCLCAVNRFWKGVVSPWLQREELVTMDNDIQTEHTCSLYEVFSVQIRLPNPENTASFTPLITSVPHTEKLSISDERSRCSSVGVPEVLAKTTEINLPELRHLHCQTKSALVWPSWAKIWLPQPLPIVSLELGGRRLDLAELNLPNLRVAIFEAEQEIRNWCECLKSSPNLEVLYLSAHNLERTPAFKVLARLSRLRHLHLGIASTPFSMRDIESIVSTLLHLESLCVAYPDEIQQEILSTPSEALIQCVKLCERRPNLRELAFARFPRFEHYPFETQQDEKAEAWYSDQLDLHMIEIARAVGPNLPRYLEYIGFGSSPDTHPRFPPERSWLMSAHSSGPLDEVEVKFPIGRRYQTAHLSVLSPSTHTRHTNHPRSCGLR